MKNLRDIIAIDEKATVETFKKGTILQFAGAYNASTFFVQKGLLRSYIIDSKGKEHIFMFAPENWIIADVEAMEFREPVQLFIDCVEDSEIIIFDKNCLFKGDLTKTQIAENAALLYRRMGKLQRRVIMLMKSPAIDRYHYFIDTYPALVNRIPQRMIASYLGITPQALSTIRGRISRKS